MFFPEESAIPVPEVSRGSIAAYNDGHAGKGGGGAADDSGDALVHRRDAPWTPAQGSECNEGFTGDFGPAMLFGEQRDNGIQAPGAVDGVQQASGGLEAAP